MRRYILYDSGCAQCDDLAFKIEKASGGALVGMSLYAREARQWLDRARPGWKFEPTLLEVDRDHVRAFTGMSMRAHLLTFLNPLQLLQVARVVKQAGVPLFGAFESHQPDPELSAQADAAPQAQGEIETETAKPDLPGGFSLTHIGPEIGEHSPVQVVTTALGQTLSLEGHATQNTLLLFFSTTCPYCHSVAQALAEYALDAPERIILAFSTAEQDKLDEFLDKHQLRDFLIVVSPETRAAFGVTGVPYGFALDREGVVRGKGIVNNSDHLDSLANTFYVSVEAFKQALASRKEERVVVS